jgi:hypothetical protein
MDIMNRETSIHSSDTLVVVDRSRRRRQLLIAAAVGVLLLVIVLAVVLGRNAANKPAQTTGAGQLATCYDVMVL